ncbi:Cupredoxin [Alternaria alternata]|nr:Cupredoxin [Alternaria alternata]
MPGAGITLPIADSGSPMLGPEDRIVYKWMVNDEAGPSLIGPTIIYASGEMNEIVVSYREFPILYNSYDEDQSFFSAVNKARIEGGDSAQYIMPQSDTTGLPDANKTVWKPQLTNFESGRQFGGAPTFFAINGFVYENNLLFEMCVGDNGFHEYAESINDRMGKKLYSKVVGEGQWQVICHVQNHSTKGMVANYRVYPKDNCPLEPLKPLRE